MKAIFLLLSLLFSMASWGQAGPVKHPRVSEVEEVMRDEVSRYFSRRFPNAPFFVKVEVAPLRRDMVRNQKTESLPYFELESEESVDEWDDPTTPIAFLRHRVTKVSIELDIPDNFEENKVAEIKEEVTAYLKLLPFRDDVKINKKIKVDKEPFILNHHYVLLFGALFASLVLGLIIRSGLTKSKNLSQAPTQAAPVQSSFNAGNISKNSNSLNGNGSGSNVTTMHDPLKTVDIVHLKMDQIEKSETFPTLSDMISLHKMGEENPIRLGALVYEMPNTWQKNLFPLGFGQSWLEAFTKPGPVDHECLIILDRLSKERSFAGKTRETEDLLIQIWRMGTQGSTFFKKIPQEHAFALLHMLPKSLSLSIAKKTFPGAWGRLLENDKSKLVLSKDVVSNYLKEALLIEPNYDWQMLENYKKDRELLMYLDQVNIDDEKDIYATLPEDSFVLRVRAPFYKVFELEETQWKDFVGLFPIDRWALAVMNSPRQYMKQVSDVLDEKQKVVFSQYLKNFDSSFSLNDQSLVRKDIADVLFKRDAKKVVAGQNVEAENVTQKSA
jgi:hypothetical protein